MENSDNKHEKKLKKSLGTFSVFAICTGAAFSSGFFLLPGIAAEFSGPSLPFVYLAAGFLMLPAVLSISELSAAMPRSGGPYFFVTRSFGPLLGMIGAFGKFFQLILKGAFAFVGVGIYLSLVMEVPVKLTAVILIVVFTIVNLLDIRQTARTEKILVVILLITLTYFVLAGATEVVSSNLQVKSRFQPLFPSGWQGFFSALAIVFISFGGVTQVASVAEEVKKPARNFPKGILSSLVVSSFFYLAGTALMIALIDPGTLRGNETPAATAAENINYLPFPVLVMVIAALAAFASTGNAAILAASRYPLALSRDRLIGSKWGKVSKKGIPQNAVLLSGGLSIALVLLLNVKEIAKTASAFLLFVFLSMCLAVIIFRESNSSQYKPEYKSPFYPSTQIIGCVIYIWLIWESGMSALTFIAGVILLAFLWYFIGIREKPHLSAAIYYLLGRIAREGTRSPGSGSFNLMLDRSNLASTVEHAMVINLKDKTRFEDAVQQAAIALEHRLGGKRKDIANILMEEVRHWKSPVRFHISVAPGLLQGIEQPEMVILRGEITTEEEIINGLIVVVDDKHSPHRLLKLITQLETAINHHDFPKAWKQAESTADIKETLFHDIGSLTLAVNELGPTAKLIGKKVKDLELPKNSLIGSIYRKGDLLIPNGNTEIQKDDELIILARGEAFDSLAEQFSEEIKT